MKINRLTLIELLLCFFNWNSFIISCFMLFFEVWNLFFVIIALSKFEIRLQFNHFLFFAHEDTLFSNRIKNDRNIEFIIIKVTKIHQIQKNNHFFSWFRRWIFDDRNKIQLILILKIFASFNKINDNLRVRDFQKIIHESNFQINQQFEEIV